MKIVRNGSEIELTSQELLNAYYEQRHEFDKEDVVDELSDRMEENLDVIQAARILGDDSLISRIAHQKREKMDMLDWQTAVIEAVDEAIEAMKAT